MNLNDLLMAAVADCDVARTKELLAQGADPNYYQERDDENPDDPCQPTTPLRMVVFRISDSFLTEDHLAQFEEITRLLLKAGADPKPAQQLANQRYGAHDPTDPDKSSYWKIRDLIDNYPKP
jgi:hypothetical protein